MVCSLECGSLFPDVMLYLSDYSSSTRVSVICGRFLCWFEDLYQALKMFWCVTNYSVYLAPLSLQKMEARFGVLLTSKSIENM